MITLIIILSKNDLSIDMGILLIIISHNYTPITHKYTSHNYILDVRMISKGTY